MRLAPQHHTIIATGVAEPGGSADALVREILSETLSRQGLDPARLTGVDGGGGFRYLIPAGVAPPSAALDPFAARLGTALRKHRLRLRVAIHSGVLYAEPGGPYTGVPLTDCARLLDAGAAHAQLDDHPQAGLVLLLTDPFYRDVVATGTASGPDAAGTALDPGAFRAIPIRADESERTAWAYLPDVAPVAASEPPPRVRPQPVPAVQANSVVWIEGDHHRFNGPIVGGDYHA